MTDKKLAQLIMASKLEALIRSAMYDDKPISREEFLQSLSYAEIKALTGRE